MTDTLHTQGGEHYRKMRLQPMDFCNANMNDDEFIGAMKWNIQKYVWRDKGEKKSDLIKIKHYCDMWLQRIEECLQRIEDGDVIS